MRITFIGAGNVAWHLSKALENAGHGVAEVWSRQQSHARSLSVRLYDATATDSLNFSESIAEVFFLTVPDHAQEEILSRIVLPDRRILVHTSGSRSLEELESWLEQYDQEETAPGVFYPLQTFSRQVPVSFEETPICLEARDGKTESTLIRLAQDISQTAYLVTSQERMVLHLGAVLACNFTNHLWALTKDLLDRHELDFSLLRPLIEENVRKALSARHPREVQTGPAIRGDRELIRRHLDFLSDEPRLQAMYRLLSESISSSA